MKTYKRTGNTIFHTDLERNCTHPDEDVRTCFDGGTRMIAGEVDDNIRETLVCTACGCEVVMVEGNVMDRYISHEWGWA